MKTAPRWIVVFAEPKQVPVYINDCRLVVTMMTGNAYFPTPTPPLALVTAHIDTLDAHELLARKGGVGLFEQRDASLNVLQIDMRLVKAHVQSVADAHPYAEAESIIKSAGMGVARRRTWTKPDVAAQHGKIPGRVVLRAKALPGPVQYRWQMSTDQQTWIDLEETFKAETIVDGLTPATVHHFRLRTVTRDGLSGWSQVVSIIVH